jgi:hypothetical protein
MFPELLVSEAEFAAAFSLPTPKGDLKTLETSRPWKRP